MSYVRDMGSTELFRYSEERSRRRRAARSHRQRIRRIGVPLAMIATASGTAVTSFAGSAQAAGGSSNRVATRSHNRILRIHSTGPDVVRLQRLLGITADGVFGHQTLRAVKSFQHAHGLLVDGQVGPHTWGALTAGHGSSGGSLILQFGSRGAAVADLQQRLGLSADGDFGPITKAAVKAFQSAHGLVVDGQAGPVTLGELHRLGSWHVPASSLPHQHIHQPTQAPAAGRAEQAVHMAERYLGVRYVYGGEGPSGFDCSGLVQYAYARIGISIPRTTYAQYSAGVPVSRSELEPGDLLFFDHVGHVGMYIGGGRFIHAPHTGTVVQIGVLSGWYSENYVGARRIVH